MPLTALTQTTLNYIFAALFLAAGVQTLRLAGEQAQHAKTKQQWAEAVAQAASGVAQLSQQHRATEAHLKEKANAAMDSYLLAAEQGQLARADAVRAAERLRQLAAAGASAAAGLPTSAASAAAAGANCGAQLATCAGLLAAGQQLVASGAELATTGNELADGFAQKVTLCKWAWPADVATAAAPPPQP